jgi:hypothetical protein
MAVRPMAAGVAPSPCPSPTRGEGTRLMPREQRSDVSQSGSAGSPPPWWGRDRERGNPASSGTPVVIEPCFKETH